MCPSGHIQAGSGIIGVLFNTDRSIISQWRTQMTWNTPKIVEICVGLEINSYACAEV